MVAGGLASSYVPLHPSVPHGWPEKHSWWEVAWSSSNLGNSSFDICFFWIDLSVPNKSMLLFLLFLLTLSRLPLRPFLSDNEPGMLSSWACVGPRPGWKQDCMVQTRGFLSHCADFPLAGPITAISLLHDG